MNNYFRTHEIWLKGSEVTGNDQYERTRTREQNGFFLELQSSEYYGLDVTEQEPTVNHFFPRIHTLLFDRESKYSDIIIKI